MTEHTSTAGWAARGIAYLKQGRRSLFVKLFLSIWILNILSTLLVFGITIQATRGQIQDARQRYRDYHAQVQDQMLWFFADATLKTHFAPPREASEITPFLFDPQGRQISGPPPTENVRKVLAKLDEQERAHIFSDQRRLVVARRVIDHNGQVYRAAAIMPELPQRPKSRLFPLPRIFKAQLLTTFVVFGLACYWLTRHFTTTVGQLRQATRRLADGDLDIRVSPPLPGREDELSLLARDFDRMAQRIQGLIEERQLLLRNISHELRSPLARLSVALGIARRNAPAEMTAPLERIDRETERLNTLIGQILSLNRLDAPADQRLMAEVDLCEMLSAIVSDAAFEAQAKQVRINLQPCQAVWVTAALDLLYAAVENVLRNAVLAAPQGSQVTLELTGDGSPPLPVVITIRDTGPGVPEAMLPHIFEPFYRVADDRNRRTGGSGIGLAIADQAIRHHGGTIRAHNRAEGGLQVTIRLPRQNTGRTAH